MELTDKQRAEQARAHDFFLRVINHVIQGEDAHPISAALGAAYASVNVLLDVVGPEVAAEAFRRIANTLEELPDQEIDQFN